MKLLWFAFGFVLATMLSFATATVDAERAVLAMGSFNGTAIPLQFDTSGYIKVKVN